MYFRPEKTTTMYRGKSTCKVLKEVRRKVAQANDIPLEERECTHKGDCAGTCPYCEAEVRYLERELSKRRSLGKAVAVAGIAVAAVMPAMAQTPETNNPANGPVKTADQNDPENAAQPKTCDTFPMPGIVPQNDSSSTAAADTVVIEWEPPEYSRGDVTIWSELNDSVWRFPSIQGTLKSYLREQLKKDPELRGWLRKKVANQLRDKSKEAVFSLEFNTSGEFFDLFLNFDVFGVEDEREYEKLFRVFLEMPAWELYPDTVPPAHYVRQRIPVKLLR